MSEAGQEVGQQRTGQSGVGEPRSEAEDVAIPFPVGQLGDLIQRDNVD